MNMVEQVLSGFPIRVDLCMCSCLCVCVCVWGGGGGAHFNQIDQKLYENYKINIPPTKGNPDCETGFLK